MIKGDYELKIVSSFDREKLTCEIWYQGEELAEISQETDDLLLSLYPPRPNSNKWWDVPLKEFQEILEIAKLHLLGKYKA